MDFNFRRAFAPLFTGYPMMWFLAAMAEIVLFIWLFINPFDDGLNAYRIQAMALIPTLTLAVAVLRRYDHPPYSASWFIFFVNLAISCAIKIPVEMTSIFGPVPKYGYFFSGPTVASWSMVAGQVALAFLALFCLYLYCARNQHRVQS